MCFSGGGIRSATFCLGVLQGLARHNLIDKFTYLSTVSGGGYIGSWLTAWIHHKNLAVVQANLRNENLPNGEAEPPEITHLRSYSNYMSPRVGLFSADFWTLVSIYFRNLLLNWTVFIPLIAAFLLIPKLFIQFLGWNHNSNYLFIFWAITILAGILAVSNINAMRPSLENYSWVSQRFITDDIGSVKSNEIKVFIWTILPALILAFGMTTYWFWDRGQNHLPLSSWFANILGITNVKLIEFIEFSVFLFLGGYLTSWSIMFWKYRNFKKVEKETVCEDEKAGIFGSIGKWIKIYFSEPFYSIICGAIGGAILFWVVENLSWLSSPIYDLLQK